MAKRRKISKTAAADQHGLFQHFQAETNDYATRERYLAMRGGSSVGRSTESLYDLSEPGRDSRVPTEYVAPHLSTRYSPDRVGVQAKRVSDGVYQDPYTNKIYDYNEGFKTEDGRSFPGGAASLQSSLMRVASNLDLIGLSSTADSVDLVLKKIANEAIADTILEEDLKKDLEEGPDATESGDPCVSKDKEAILRALFEAHEDQSSPYKLSIGRWDDITPCNLTTDERDIVEASAGELFVAAKALVTLSKAASKLEDEGFDEEAHALDDAAEDLERELQEGSNAWDNMAEDDIVLMASSMDERGEYIIADILDTWLKKRAE